MSQIDDLLVEHCPRGVESSPLVSWSGFVMAKIINHWELATYQRTVLAAS